MISITKSLVTFVALVAAGLSIFLLAICLDKNPFQLQITSIFGYTTWVFYLIFCDSRWWRGYSLRQKEVQKELPRLLSMHGAFLVFLVALETMALWAQPRLPSYWRSEYGSRHDSLFVDVLILAGVGVGMTQILMSRKILGRAVGENA